MHESITRYAAPISIHP
jgi:hypothetical protein